MTSIDTSNARSDEAEGRACHILSADFAKNWVCRAGGGVTFLRNG
jgi:hypothetical protein